MKINGNKILKGLMAVGLTACAVDVILDLVVSIREMCGSYDDEGCNFCACNGCCECSEMPFCAKEMHRGCECQSGCPGSESAEEQEADAVASEPVAAPETGSGVPEGDNGEHVDG